MSVHKAIHLAERPFGNISPDKTFSVQTHDNPKSSDLQDGEVILKTLYLSIDPAMRGWLDDDRSYLPPVQIGAVMRGQGLAFVQVSQSRLFPPGSVVLGNVGWREISVLHENALETVLTPPDVRLTDSMGVLGFTGMTAYFGLTDIARVQRGDLVVVTGAGGATGSIAGQIAKLKGATVVGITGSDEKCDVLVSKLGFDRAVNYKAPDFEREFCRATENMIDVFFDNVGGEILDLALTRAKPHARFVICGAISQHNTATPYGLKNSLKVARLRIRMQGFILLDYKDRFHEARSQLAEWLQEGQIRGLQTIVKGGLIAAPQALQDLYKGKNTGRPRVSVLFRMLLTVLRAAGKLLVEIATLEEVRYSK